MEILIYKDLILGFIRQNMSDKSHQKWIKTVLENEHSTFLYSKQYFQNIQATLEDTDEDSYQAWVKNVMDHGKNIKNTNQSNDFDALFEEIHAKSMANLVLTIAYQESNRSIQNIAILSKAEKPNYHWLVTTLAALHPNKISVSCHDFNENIAVDTFFEAVFEIPRKISEVKIFDRQCNLEHCKFDKIQSVYVHYYTAFFRNDMPQIKRDIQAKFRRSKVWTTQAGLAHGRRIIFENIILLTDHDFRELEIDRDWFIDIQYSPDEVKKWLDRTQLYRAY